MFYPSANLRAFDKYQLLDCLAQGGLGAIYLAVTGDRGFERLMILKTVVPALIDAAYAARFRDEAKAATRLSHDNLLRVFDAGFVLGEAFLAMDFLEGRDLRSIWNRCARKQVAFPIDLSVHIIKELCRGLAHAHAFLGRPILHRDVSPPHIAISYTGEVKLLDLGLAPSTLKPDVVAPGIATYGNVAYQSPEQARSEPLDGRSDMYSAGVVLWELLTGRQLFPPSGDQLQDLASRASTGEPMRPSQRASRVPIELDAICLKALSPSKRDRYADCDEMAQVLGTWLEDHAPTTDETSLASFMLQMFAVELCASGLSGGEAPRPSSPADSAAQRRVKN